MRLVDQVGPLTRCSKKALKTKLLSDCRTYPFASEGSIEPAVH